MVFYVTHGIFLNEGFSRTTFASIAMDGVEIWMKPMLIIDTKKVGHILHRNNLTMKYNHELLKFGWKTT